MERLQIIKRILKSAADVWVLSKLYILAHKIRLYFWYSPYQQ